MSIFYGNIYSLRQYLGVSVSPCNREHIIIEIEHKYELVDYLVKES